MSITATEKIWCNGQMIPWGDANIHVLSHGLHYGTSFFEGIRVYDTPSGPVGFRLREHMQRLLDSAKIYHVTIPYTLDELCAAACEVIRVNGLKSAYIRPIAFVGYGSIGVAPTAANPIEMYIAAFPWGAYLGDEGRNNGVDVAVSSWSRIAPNTIPALAKAGGNYLSGVLISSEAKSRGFAEGIALSHDGHLSEGAGENLFVVAGGEIYTPPAAASILQGLTRDTVIKLAARRGWTVAEKNLPRELLYVCDEAFFTGTAAEITPIRSVDGRTTKSNGPGPITKQLQADFFGLFTGETQPEDGWFEKI